MYRLYIKDDSNEYHYAELCREFLSDDEFEIISLTSLPCSDYLCSSSYVLGDYEGSDRDSIKRDLYLLLRNITGLEPEWGTLTGVRPLKPALGIYNQCGSFEEMKETLRDRYLLSDSKLDLLSETADYQINHIDDEGACHVSIYIGIPFCPTRCEYCSFASNVADPGAISRYLTDLYAEIDYTGRLYEKNKIGIESIYVGGGTPTTLEPDQLSDLIKRLSDAFWIRPSDTEFTVEAGRPDTISADKLSAIRKLGVSRISINPQSMKDETLRLIGRNHSSDEIREAFAMARDLGFDFINADLIAGLPGESCDDFKKSLDEIIDLGAENITIHTLSVKRGSALHENDPEYYRRDTKRVSDMLGYSRLKLSESLYQPYYLYRQKHQIGAFENVGYCLEGKHSVYNIRIMEDRQSIIALGAGAVGKLYYPGEDRIERIANISNYELYSERFSDILAGKDRFFGGLYGF